MTIQTGTGPTKYGPGVDINLTGEEVALAIYAYLTAHDVHVRGAATVTVNGELCECGNIYVDPSGRVVAKGVAYEGGPRLYGCGPACVSRSEAQHV